MLNASEEIVRLLNRIIELLEKIKEDTEYLNKNVLEILQPTI